MKALVSRTVGGPESLCVEEIALPEPGPGEVRIRVTACGVSYPDTLIIADRYQFKAPRPFSPGQEIAGRIDALGAGVSGLSLQDRVLAVLPFGGMAEYTVLGAERCLAIPDAMDVEDAAVFLGAFGTAYHALVQRAGLKAGDRLLVLGAAGGVGLGAIQLARVFGADVTAAVSDPGRGELAERHGAARTLIYPRGPFDEAAHGQLRELLKRAGPFDVVFDAVGGAYTEAALRATARNGRLLIIGFPAGIAKIPMNLPLLKQCQIVGVFYGAFAAAEPAADRENIAALLRLYLAGKIKPFISRRYPLADAPRALADMMERRGMGRLLVTM